MRASALLYSLIGTAEANGQKPFVWLRHVLERLSPGQQRLRVGGAVALKLRTYRYLLIPPQDRLRSTGACPQAWSATTTG
jgi:hypothetical protein